MSSSSSSATSNLRRRRSFEVILSFRGKDTRKNFVSHLYAALIRNKIETFIDDGLDRGLYIEETLFEKIGEARVAVVVLSKNYAYSHWCLDELVKIMDCREENGLIVYPVFYDVKPSDVSNLAGDFGDAFSKHKDAEKVELWRGTVRKVRNLTGWDLSCPDALHESECIEKIVEQVNSELDNVDNSIDKNCEHNVDIIGLLGMPGSGKTTTARAMFDDMCEQYDGHSFVQNISEVSKSRGLAFLQKQILSDVLGHEVQISDENDGCKKIRRRLSQKKVLVVLDRVDTKEQLKALVGERNWYGDGSKIIITTTDERLLLNHQLDYTAQHVILLNDDEAIQLLKRCAFQNGVPIEAHKAALERVVRYAAGHPGALKCLGSKLIGRPIDEWEDTIDSFSKCPEAGIDNMLKSSLEGLNTCEKDLFLDIACFFNGWIKDEVIDILDSCELFPISGLRTLEEKFLITYSREFIQMHNLALEMGRNIVRQEHPDDPSRQSRLWHPEDVKEVLMENKGTEDIKAIVISNLKKLDARAAFDAFTSMRKLRLLHASTRRMVLLVRGSSRASLQWIMEGSGCQEYLPCNLKWLTWDYFNLESWPVDFQAKKLVGLQIRHSSLVDLCSTRDIKFLGRLKFLDLSFSSHLIRTPNFGCLPHLRKLILEFCSSLVEVHPSIRVHSNLVHLNLRYCDKLESLPLSLEMISLEFLNLSGCSKLTRIPDFVGMTKLLELDLSHNSVKELPSSIGDLPRLTYLDICNCKNLTSIPSSIQMLYNQAEILQYGCPAS
ncbi:disease resistance protein Roq1-like [Bidens hawaiensis]|uniref:disease resistance protein Roq1-like n=1 Tax=Bidens hawaiensis TaxID=980011 RepID=UPI00404AB180